MNLDDELDIKYIIKGKKQQQPNKKERWKPFAIKFT